MWRRYTISRFSHAFAAHMKCCCTWQPNSHTVFSFQLGRCDILYKKLWRKNFCYKSFAHAQRIFKNKPAHWCLSCVCNVQQWLQQVLAQAGTAWVLDDCLACHLAQYRSWMTLSYHPAQWHSMGHRWMFLTVCHSGTTWVLDWCFLQSGTVAQLMSWMPVSYHLAQ